MEQKQYLAIDLKSFYASVECVQRGLDPLTTNLVVADESRTSKTICLAVSPSLKSFGIPGRLRLFEVEQRVEQVNALRRQELRGKNFSAASCDYRQIRKHPAVKVDYIVAPPQMLLYEKISAQIYEVYLKYVSADDIHVYSIDEVFIDVTNYLKLYNKTAHELARTMIEDVLSETGITATAGIGTNLYLCKIAMDIVAKHIPADKDGVRIAELDEMRYREQLWSHTPITDFWRIGGGIAKRLKRLGIDTMGDIARCSLNNEEILYKEFGINAELLIDHAWGWEPCTIAAIKAYKPETKSISEGQVLKEPYSFKKAKLVVKEMTERVVLNIVEKGYVTDRVELTVGYDIENLAGGRNYAGEVKTDRYGRKVPKMAHSTENLGRYTSSTKLIMAAMERLYERIVDENLLVRRMYVVVNHLVTEEEAKAREPEGEQLSLFENAAQKEQQKAAEDKALSKEKDLQQTMIGIQKKFGKNAILKAMNLEEGATAIERNQQIGGHKA
ncbi:MAG: DNA methylase [Clostridia bacterium]|nr:DNA methylase [Clostridia bacterium]